MNKKKLKHLGLVKAVEETRHTGQASIEQTCQRFDLHRDAYYKFKIRKQEKETIEK